jgi:hypothetical protein
MSVLPRGDQTLAAHQVTPANVKPSSQCLGVVAFLPEVGGRQIARLAKGRSGVGNEIMRSH